MEETWNGFRCENIEFEGHPAVIVYPAEGTANGQLALKTVYWGAFPRAIEVPLLEKGFHVCYINNDNRFGMDKCLDRTAKFVRYVQMKCGLQSKKCALVGMSCGGMVAIKFAARYPELVSCMYLDAPVVNYMSWPCGFGIGKGKHPTDDKFAEILSVLGMTSISELLACRTMPLDVLPELVKHNIPVVMVSGDSDYEVPYCENGIFVEKAYKDAGAEIEVYIKPGGDHHPHGLPNPEVLVDFVLRHCR